MVRTVLLASLLLVSPAVAGVADAHPLHTSMAELTHDPKSGVITVSVKVFRDDLGRAARARARSSHSLSSSAQAVNYVISAIRLADISGVPIAMGFCGISDTGDLTVVCLRGRERNRGNGISVSNRVLFDQFRDQINVMAAEYDGRKSHHLFAPGDPPAVLR